MMESCCHCSRKKRFVGELTEVSTWLVSFSSRIVNPVIGVQSGASRVLDDSRLLPGMIPLHPRSCPSVAAASMSKTCVRCDTHFYDGLPHGVFNKDPCKTTTLIEIDRFLASLGRLTGEPALKKAALAEDPPAPLPPCQ